MWPFGKTCSLEESGVFKGFTDCHSHILPGVDDGVRTMEESLEILHRYEQLGVGAVWLTPHIMEDIPNTTEDLKSRFRELESLYGGRITLRLAAEYMLDTLFAERLEKNDLLPLGEKSNHLLVETSYFNPPLNLYRILEEIKTKGFHPVLAHPERYAYMDEKDYRKLQNLGVGFQMNLPSLTGMYGKRVRGRAEWLLKNKLFNYTGTDLHGIGQLHELLFRKICKTNRRQQE
jgi:tyrosine-protein phosphatase YwqE